MEWRLRETVFQSTVDRRVVDFLTIGDEGQRSLCRESDVSNGSQRN